jgi:anti-anti-sigma factor
MAENQYRCLQCHLERSVLVLTITVEQVEGVAVGSELLREMLQAAAEFEAKNVVVDFQRTKYISSTAFRPLLGLRSKIRERGGQVILCGLSPPVGDVLITTRLVCPDGSPEAPFGLEPDVAAAIAKLT